jgi:tetratricopeptide (TPR) repeat protein
MDEAESHYYRALELFEKKRDAINAIRAVDRLLGLHPDDVVLHHQKNEFAIMTNDRELLVSSYLDLAACLRRQNGFRSARTVYGRILDLDPGNAEARAGIAAVDADELARERHRQQQPERRSSEDVVSTEIESTGVEVLQPSGEIDAMFQDLNAGDEEAEPTPPDYESHFELGIAFQQMEMWDEAAREFKLAVQGVADPLPAYERLGECLLALRRYDEARRTLGLAVAQPGQDEEKIGVLFHLGVAHLRSGDQAAARACLEQVVQIDPSRADAAHLLSTLPA